ncbi:MAG TPA: response regulator [Spirochaetota bacterium]|nr:response regulator [Spirochaetota bacterium]HOH38141.1 response regulator [Spirochaetota bacterium]
MMNSKKIRILAVDDIYANRFLLSDVLSDFKTTVAENASDFWKRLESYGADIALLDIMMPDEDGFHLAARMKADERFKNIPIIFISAKNAKNDVMEGMNAGGNDYIIKPIDGDILVEKIKNVLYQNTVKLITEKYEKERKLLFIKTGKFRIMLNSIGKLTKDYALKNLPSGIPVDNIDEAKGVLLYDNLPFADAEDKSNILISKKFEISLLEIVETEVVGNPLEKNEIDEINQSLSSLGLCVDVNNYRENQ